MSENLKRHERRYFLRLLGEFRAGRVPAGVPREVLRSWGIRFKVEYLAAQSFFAPFPAEPLLPLDSGKGPELRSGYPCINLSLGAPRSCAESSRWKFI